MKSRGFTLIELMIVVAIIAIIAAIAIPNLLRSRMAANESAAIGACKAYAEAQEIFRRTDYDSDGILEYATTIRGANSLYEITSGTGDLTLVDAAFARAEGDTPGGGGTVEATAPKAGYIFSVLTGQGASAPGGSKTYVINSNMTVGYGLSAIPSTWDASGRNSFQINNTGTVYQRDQGATTSHLTVYGADTTWVVSE